MSIYVRATNPCCCLVCHFELTPYLRCLRHKPMGKFTSSTKSKARNMLKFETPAGQDHTTGNAHRKLGEVWTRGF